MRLIDAETTVNAINDAIYRQGKFVKDIVSVLIEIINSQPTADVKEVKFDESNLVSFIQEDPVNGYLVMVDSIVCNVSTKRPDLEFKKLKQIIDYYNNAIKSKEEKIALIEEVERLKKLLVLVEEELKLTAYIGCYTCGHREKGEEISYRCREECPSCHGKDYKWRYADRLQEITLHD